MKGFKYKIIAKDFDDFKKIISSNEKRKVLLRGNWFQRTFWLSMEGEPIIENDSIKITFFSDVAEYSAEFVRNVDTNEILIKNSTFEYYYYFFLNRWISKRILKNWDKC